MSASRTPEARTPKVELVRIQQDAKAEMLTFLRGWRQECLNIEEKKHAVRLHLQKLHNGELDISTELGAYFRAQALEDEIFLARRQLHGVEEEMLCARGIFKQELKPMAGAFTMQKHTHLLLCVK